MESYVTRREFENVIKEVRRLQYFLADTFGPKFMEFFKDDKFGEVESTLKNDLGNESTNVLNASLTGVLSKSSSLPSGGGGPMENINKVPPPPSVSPPAVSVATRPSARLILQDASTREYAQKMVRNAAVDEVIRNRPSSSQHSTTTAPVVPISVVKSLKRKLPPGENHEETRSSSPSPQMTERNMLSDDDVKVELVDLDADNDEINKEVHDEPMAPPKPAFLHPMPPTAPLPSFRHSKFQSKLKKPDSGEIIQCPQCHLYIYSNQMDEHLKTHSILNGNGKKPSEKPSSSINLFSKSPLTCFLCKTEFPTFQFYEGHCNLHHRDGNPCPICFKVLRPHGKLRKHMDEHENPKLKKTFRTKKTHPPPQQTSSAATTTMTGSEFGEVDKDQDNGHEGGDNIVGELIEVKMDVGDTVQFEYEGDDDDELF
ncbi:Zinc finger and BTB domain-containing protein 40 [Orchesella cincta]|uniref:Zinc finger and BTB domain-containing protein 40 n=1 Tax=Orchesella cincta TaxID=48709 RepID=A0A1D2MVG5_ORCCI|nr:Zinc finger and BTB domain-containing protein 40 [Orchesella cincta]